MQILRDILSGVKAQQIFGNVSVAISSICIDSRMVATGSLFLAVRGTTTDGHDYIEKAVAQGAAAIICEQLPESPEERVTFVRVENTSIAAGQMAAAFYNYPSASMKVVGVTGTNGKTTTATLLFRLFKALGHTCGLISTVENHIGDIVETATHTTPDAISVQQLLSRMKSAGCGYVFMEVSSHAVHQRRIEGIEFTGGVFTNITHDHLDYHNTFDEYIAVKKKFFDDLPETAFALTNLDDKRGTVMLQNTPARKESYSLRVPATFKGKVLENNLTGLILDINNQEVHCRLVGTFNAYNLLAIYGVAILLEQDRMDVLSALSNLQGAPGRFETYLSPQDKILGIVDYAHTPDALINVLATVNQLRTAGQQIITVVGCGGDRDKTKRPVMAEVACTHSDKAVLTADNPRSEDPEAILNDMESGLNAAQRRKSLRITDRREAIKTACSLAQPGDIILVAGKGHETYQEIKGVKYDFDDRKVLTETFELLEK